MAQIKKTDVHNNIVLRYVQSTFGKVPLLQPLQLFQSHAISGNLKEPKQVISLSEYSFRGTIDARKSGGLNSEILT